MAVQKAGIIIPILILLAGLLVAAFGFLIRGLAAATRLVHYVFVYFIPFLFLGFVAFLGIILAVNQDFIQCGIFEGYELAQPTLEDVTVFSNRIIDFLEPLVPYWNIFNSYLIQLRNALITVLLDLVSLLLETDSPTVWEFIGDALGLALDSLIVILAPCPTPIFPADGLCPPDCANPDNPICVRNILKEFIALSFEGIAIILDFLFGDGNFVTRIDNAAEWLVDVLELVIEVALNGFISLLEALSGPGPPGAGNVEIPVISDLARVILCFLDLQTCLCELVNVLFVAVCPPAPQPLFFDDPTPGPFSVHSQSPATYHALQTPDYKPNATSDFLKDVFMRKTMVPEGEPCKDILEGTNPEELLLSKSITYQHIKYVICTATYGAGKRMSEDDDDFQVGEAFHAPGVKKMIRSVFQGIIDREKNETMVKIRGMDIPFNRTLDMSEGMRYKVGYISDFIVRWERNYNVTSTLFYDAYSRLNRALESDGGIIVWNRTTNAWSRSWQKNNYTISELLSTAHRHANLSEYHLLVRGEKKYHYEKGYMTHEEYDDFMAEKKIRDREELESRMTNWGPRLTWQEKMDGYNERMENAELSYTEANPRPGDSSPEFIDLIDTLTGGLATNAMTFFDDIVDAILNPTTGLGAQLVDLFECTTYFPQVDPFSDYQPGCGFQLYINPEQPRIPVPPTTFTWALKGPASCGGATPNQPMFEPCADFGMKSDGWGQFIYIFDRWIPSVMTFLRTSIIALPLRLVPFLNDVIFLYDGITLTPKHELCFVLTFGTQAQPIAILLLGVLLLITFGVFVFWTLFTFFNLFWVFLYGANRRLQNKVAEDSEEKEERIEQLEDIVTRLMRRVRNIERVNKTIISASLSGEWKGIDLGQGKEEEIAIGTEFDLKDIDIDILGSPDDKMELPGPQVEETPIPLYWKPVAVLWNLTLRTLKFLHLKRD